MMRADRPLGPSTAIVTDSSADLPADQRRANWHVVPIPVNFGAEAFHDGVDLDPPAFYRRLADTGVQPTTAQPSVQDLTGAYRAALADHGAAVVLHLSGRMSGTVGAARDAALSVDPGRLLVLETSSVSILLGLLVHRVQARLDRGSNAGEIQSLVADFRRRQATVFSVETLEYLRRGGRIGRATALAGSLLRVRALLDVSDGEVGPAGRVRGAARVLPALRELVEARTERGRPLRVALGHAARPDAVPQLEAMLREARPLSRLDVVTEIGPTVGTHAGPGTLGIAMFHDPLDTGGG
jgi:DegV family protein with EDD domain